MSCCGLLEPTYIPHITILYLNFGGDRLGGTEYQWVFKTRSVFSMWSNYTQRIIDTQHPKNYDIII